MGLWFEEPTVTKNVTDEELAVKYADYYKLSKEESRLSDFWTNQFFNSAYDIVKDRKAPIVIPSYNRPNNIFSKYYDLRTVEGREWPVYFVVRESQKEMYENGEYIKKHPSLHVLAFPDDEIDDIGKVRKKIVEYFTDKEKFVFMFDDDINKISYSVPLQRESEAHISFALMYEEMSKVMAMWQIAMEYACTKKEDVMMSCGMVQGFSWTENRCFENRSMQYLSGGNTLSVCLNLDTFKKLGINYRTIKGNGHDDIDLMIRGLQKGGLTCEFSWLSFASSAIGTDIVKAASVQERFQIQYDEMYNNFKDVPFIKWRHRKGRPNVGIVWSKAVEYFTAHGYGDLSNARKYDLWRGGKLLEDAKNNYVEVEKWPN